MSPNRKRAVLYSTVAVVIVLVMIALGQTKAHAWSAPSLDVTAQGCERATVTAHNGEGQTATVRQYVSGPFHIGDTIPAHGDAQRTVTGYGTFTVKFAVDWPGDHNDRWAEKTFTIPQCPPPPTTTTTLPPPPPSTTLPPPSTTPTVPDTRPLPPGPSGPVPTPTDAVQPRFTG